MTLDVRELPELPVRRLCPDGSVQRLLMDLEGNL